MKQQVFDGANSLETHLCFRDLPFKVADSRNARFCFSLERPSLTTYSSSDATLDHDCTSVPTYLSGD